MRMRMRMRTATVIWRMRDEGLRTERVEAISYCVVNIYVS